MTEQLTRLDCPACEDAVDARYLGTASADDHAGHVVGWECTGCDAQLEEDVSPRGDSWGLREVRDDR